MLWFFMFMALHKIQLLVNWGKYFLILVIDISESQGLRTTLKTAGRFQDKLYFDD